MISLGTLLCIGLVALLPSSEGHSVWEGTWLLAIGKGGFDRTIRCSVKPEVVAKEFKVKLECPNRAVDEFGNEGYWTSVMEYGVEIVIQGRKFYSFPWKRWNMNDTDDKQLTWRGMPVGWSHDVLGNNWACFYGIRRYSDSDSPVQEAETVEQPLHFESHASGSQMFRSDPDLISAINEGQGFWSAKLYPEFENLTEEQMTNLAGGKYSKFMNFPKQGKTQTNITLNWTLPANFDWRNVRGKNFVSPVRNQGYCGSCYAFAATAMHEARVRILTGNALTPIYSPQDVVDCSPYAFGCSGGFLFSEGKFGEDFGFAEESCSPYQAREKTCTSLKCRRAYFMDYEFIGSDIGGCNELAMRLAILYNGPIVVGYKVFHDFVYYQKGIYYHYGRNWPLGGHAVALVGWGEDARTGTKYWIAKNSWGSFWGENGYFRIIRGVNECQIESFAWQASPIL